MITPAKIVSVIAHAGLIALLFTISHETAKPRLETRFTVTKLTAPVLRMQQHANGGGGGEHSILPATKGRLPKIAPRQFVPPTVPVNLTPKLTIEPTIEMAADIKADMVLTSLGDPLSRFNNGSGGTGGPFGIGNGNGTGVGDKSGPSAGDGDGSREKIFRAGHGVTGPILIHRVDPEFSDEARKSKFSGTVLIHAEIDPSGRPRNLRLARSVGMGLDEKAMEAVTQWLFKPGMKDGKPVTVAATIEVKFELL